jgi:hypothetical protein
MTASPVGSGTGLFIGAVCLAIIWYWALSNGNYISKDNFK